MSLQEMEARADSSRIHSKRKTSGNLLIRVSGTVLLLSSVAKFIHPAPVVAYMASMGYSGATFFLIATLELLSAILFLSASTRPFGLLLISSYLGGAISAHLATHHSFTGGPFLVFMSYHPYIGALVPSTVLALAWVGACLQHPELLPSLPLLRGSRGDSHHTRHEISLG